MTLLGFALVAAALALGLAWLLAWPLFAAWLRLLGALDPARALRLARWNPVVLVVPLTAGLVLALAGAGLFDFGEGGLWACHCGGDGLHLCAHHPTRALGLVGPAALVALLVLPRLRRQLRQLRAAARLGRQLDALAAHAPSEAGVLLVPLDARNAYATPGRHPRVVADRTWWQSLSATERRIVQAHEAAHVQRRDPRTLGLVRLVASVLPRSADRLVWWWHAGAEHAADRLAARAVGDPLAVAAFLLRQARPHPSPGVAFHGTATALRISALIERPDAPTHPEGDLDTTVSGALLLALLGVAFGCELHHLSERFLAWLS